MKRLIFSLLLLILLLSACGTSQNTSSFQLYFLTPSQVAHGPAIASQPYTETESPGVEELVHALLEGPKSDDLVSPFPKGVSLLSWELEDGLLTLNLSEQYGGLTAISLTLADYCFVLTLSQLDGVEAVQIQSAGHTYDTRSHQILSPDEVYWDVQEVFTSDS